MNELGRLEDLPEDYRAALAAKNLVPLWPSLRAVLPPGKPAIRTQPTCWSYQGLRPLLMRAGELTPIEKAERRVLVLANPGHGLEKMQASATIYLGMQLLQPGEWAPSHRHTPNAVRMIVEGTGAYTTVEGEKCPMHRGDLILTPTGMWHEHGHDGSDTARLLESGEADLAVGFVPQLEAGFHQQSLFVQNFVCMLARDHPRIGDSLGLAEFEAEDHAVISSSGAAPSILEREIARQGITRRVVLKIPSFLGAAFVIEHTDLLLTVPRRLGDVLQGRGAFRFLPVPFPLPEYEVKQHWHERYHHDEGNRWLRRLVSRLLAGAA